MATAQPRTCQVIAHRGGAAEVPENTWAAVRHVADLGLTWMETDLRCSADGVVILAHDADAVGIPGDPRPISQLTWRELENCNAGDGAGPVRLDDALRVYPQVHFNMDLKDGNVIAGAAQVVRDLGAQDRVRFASFSAKRLAALRALLPGVRTSLGMADVSRLVGVAQLGLPLLPERLPEAVDAVQVPTRQYGIPVADARFVAAAHARGLEVHVWTINDPDEMRRLRDLHVDAVITDVPTLALQTLAA